MEAAATNLRVAFSPCPNDTFLFHSWVAGQSGKIPITPVLADIQQLNQWALEKKFPVSKVSISALGHLLDDYVLLPSGCTLGHGCGPKIIARTPTKLSELAGKRIAIPGKHTTAYLLLQILCDIPVQPVFCTYDRITDLLKNNQVDLGLIVHETRFTFAHQGFYEVADLGELWEQKYQLPLPLGGIVAKRTLGSERLETINAAIAQSLQMAKQSPKATMAYVLKHSQEKDPIIVQSHIDLYITAETAKLSSQGYQSIETLLKLAQERHLIRANKNPWLFNLTPASTHG